MSVDEPPADPALCRDPPPKISRQMFDVSSSPRSSGKTPSGLVGQRLTTLSRLLRALQQGTYTFTQLRERVNPEDPVSIRTMRRYLAQLDDAGFVHTVDPITRTYKVASEVGLMGETLRPDDAGTLLALRSLAEQLGPSAVEFLDRVARAPKKPAEVTHLVKLPPVTLDLDNETFVDLRRAVRQRQTVEFDYVNNVGQRSHRRLDPYGLLSSNGRSYVVGMCHRAREIRNFAVDQIDGLRFTPSVFSKPDSFRLEEWHSGSISGVLQPTDDVAVTVRFTRQVRGAALRAGGPERLSTAEAPAGDLDVTYRVRRLDEFVRWILTWGMDFEVLEPARVRADIAALTARIAASHDPDRLDVAS